MAANPADSSLKIVHMMAVSSTSTPQAVCDADTRQLVKNVCAVELTTSDLGIVLNEHDLGQAIDWTQVVGLDGRVNNVNGDAPGLPDVKYPGNGCNLTWGKITSTQLTTSCTTQGKLLTFLAKQYTP